MQSTKIVSRNPAWKLCSLGSLRLSNRYSPRIKLGYKRIEIAVSKQDNASNAPETVRNGYSLACRNLSEMYFVQTCIALMETHTLKARRRGHDSAKDFCQSASVLSS